MYSFVRDEVGSIQLEELFNMMHLAGTNLKRISLPPSDISQVDAKTLAEVINNLTKADIRQSNATVTQRKQILLRSLQGTKLKKLGMMYKDLDKELVEKVKDKFKLYHYRDY